MTATTDETTTIEIPAIMTANTYFWRPGSSASQRRANEKRYAAEVQAFLDRHAEALAAAGISVEFSYWESCNHVYKRLEIYRNGKRSNIRALKKALGIS
jgi:hypothetical protein